VPLISGCTVSPSKGGGESKERYGVGKGGEKACGSWGYSLPSHGWGLKAKKKASMSVRGGESRKQSRHRRICMDLKMGGAPTQERKRKGGKYPDEENKEEKEVKGKGSLGKGLNTHYCD